MPVWPKSFYTFGASLKTAATEWKLRQKRGAPAAQARVFAGLTPRLAAASFWRQIGIERGLRFETFQKRVPLQNYSRLAPAIARMQRGEADVLWPGRCALFARTSGTTGQPKLLPMTEEMLAHFRRAGFDALLYYTVRVRHAGIFRGRHLLIGGPTVLEPLATEPPHEAYAGELTGIVALNLPTWAEKHLYEPGVNAAGIADWEARLNAIVARTSDRDISLVAGQPNWLALVGAELLQRCASAGQRPEHLQTLWPNLECLVHTGTSMAPFAARLHALCGPRTKFHEIYTATEGFIASQDVDGAAAGMRLMADMGIFFEFLPVGELDENRLDQLGPKTVPIDGVKTGVDYALVITTPGGLARYVLEDIVRFVSTQPPRLVHVGHTKLQLTTFGERVTEKELTDALVAVCARHDWTIVNFHVAPLASNPALTGQQRGRHEWWLELKPGTVATPTGPQIAAQLDPELQRLNPDYAARRKTGILDLPTVRLVMPGVFEHWLRFQGMWGAQHKLPRSRNDRFIADQLAQLTHFARD